MCSFPHTPGTGVLNHVLLHSAFIPVLGSELKSLCLGDRCFTDSAVSLSPLVTLKKWWQSVLLDALRLFLVPAEWVLGS